MQRASLAQRCHATSFELKAGKNARPRSTRGWGPPNNGDCQGPRRLAEWLAAMAAQWVDISQPTPPRRHVYASLATERLCVSCVLKLGRRRSHAGTKIPAEPATATTLPRKQRSSVGASRSPLV